MTIATFENQENVKEGIEFLLSHFEGKQRLFPRKMSTFASNGKQFTVYNKEHIIDACIKANFIDCRINGYSILEDGLLQAPNVIFIDLDISSNLMQLNRNLKKTLKIIKEKLNGFEPTVLWSGNGYHIYMVLDIRPLELIEQFRELSNEPSKQFLRFAESVFTNNNKDFRHNPSFHSCLLRIPGTYNSKNGSEVKIIQRFDENKILTIDNKLLREFRLHLADIDIKKKREAKTNEMAENASIKNRYNSSSKQYKWIEKLLTTPIEDGRKYALWKILCPYLVNVKKLEYEQTFKILKEWLVKCNNSRKLNFDIDTKIKNDLENVKHYNTISMKNLAIDNKELYLLIKN